MVENNWKLGDRPELGAMNSANRLVRELDIADPAALPDLRQSTRIVLGSDYSGQHATSKYEASAFILADIERAGEWVIARRAVRERMLDDRRFSYKSLKDTRRAAVLPEFLDATDSIPGLLAVILVEKSVGSLFKSSGRIASSDPEIQSLAHWSPQVVERLLRICHFAAFFISGLSRGGQDILWVTDEDDIVANERMHREMVNVFGQISSHYLTHTLRHLRIATTASDTGKLDLEDFVSITDLAAGAICEALNAYQRADMRPAPGFILPAPADAGEKARRLLNWFSDNRSPLKRLVLAFEAEPGTTRLRVRHYNFHGSAQTLA